jgi:peptidoglycan/LPS O-acetylase OafA/YrhL
VVEGGAPPGRVVELDALRGIAALAVVAFHYTTFYGQQIGHVPPLQVGFPAGNYGVHLFFLISGFVIFMTLERTRSAMDFVVSRFSRLFPAYWAAMLATMTVVYTIGMPDQRLPLRDLALNLTMGQQFLGAEHLDGSYWTLQVELFFYAQMLLWFALGLLGRIRWIIGAWLLLAVAYGETAQHHMHFSYSLRELLILRHIPFFALGILFYRIRTRPAERNVDMALIGACLLAIAIAGPPVLVAVALVCCALFGLFVAGWLRWLAIAPFAVLGAMSYSIYVLHQAIGFALIHQLESVGVSSMAAILLATCFVLALAALLTWGIERPAMQAMRTAWRRRRQLTQAPAGA